MRQPEREALYSGWSRAVERAWLDGAGMTLYDVLIIGAGINGQGLPADPLKGSGAAYNPPHER